MSKNTKQGQRKTSAQTQVPAVVTSAKRKETHGNVAAVNVAKLGKKKGKKLGNSARNEGGKASASLLVTRRPKRWHSWPLTGRP